MKGFVSIMVWMQVLATCIAHDYWIRVEPMAPATGDRVKVFIGGGHAFPESDVLLDERLLTGININRHAVKPETDAREWVFSWVAPSSGVFRASYQLKRPRRDEPFHEAVTWVVSGANDTGAYATGRGLELIPVSPWSALAVGESWMVEARWNGEVIEAQIGLTQPGTRAIYRRSSVDQPAVFRVTTPGPVLCTVRRQGRTASLTLPIPAR